MRIEYVEPLVEDHYTTIVLAPTARSPSANTSTTAKREAADAELERRHHRTRLAQLVRERRKLLQAHYADDIAQDLFRSEQRRINREMDTANARLDMLDQVFADIETPSTEPSNSAKTATAPTSRQAPRSGAS